MSLRLTIILLAGVAVLAVSRNVMSSDGSAETEAPASYLQKGSSYRVGRFLEEKSAPVQKSPERLKAELDLSRKDVEQLNQKISQQKERIEELTRECADLRIKLAQTRAEKMEVEKRHTALQLKNIQRRLILESKYIRTYEVEEGDTLWGIAGKEEVYSNPFKWIAIYNANKDNLSSPDNIVPGQLLKIPQQDDDLLWLEAADTETRTDTQTGAISSKTENDEVFSIEAGQNLTAR